MEDLTIGVILAIKQEYGGETSAKERVKHFLSDYTLTPYEYYDDTSLVRILRICFADYVDHAKSPRWAVIQYFKHRYEGVNGDIAAILTVLGLSQVRENLDGIWMYVNGFHDFEFKDLKLTVTGKGEWLCKL